MISDELLKQEKSVYEWLMTSTKTKVYSDSQISREDFAKLVQQSIYAQGLNPRNIQDIINALDSANTGIVEKKSIEKIFNENYQKRMQGINDFASGVLLAFNGDVGFIERELMSMV